MNREQKREYNNENENDYHFAPFTEERKELRKEWSGTRKDWNSFLYKSEKNQQLKNK